MTPDKYKWQAEYVIEQGSTPDTYQVSYKEDGELSKTIDETISMVGITAYFPVQYRSIELANQAAHKHAVDQAAKKRQGRPLISLGKLP